MGLLCPNLEQQKPQIGSIGVPFIFLLSLAVAKTRTKGIIASGNKIRSFYCHLNNFLCIYYEQERVGTLSHFLLLVDCTIHVMSQGSLFCIPKVTMKYYLFSISISSLQYYRITVNNRSKNLFQVVQSSPTSVQLGSCMGYLEPCRFLFEPYAFIFNDYKLCCVSHLPGLRFRSANAHLCLMPSIRV